MKKIVIMSLFVVFVVSGCTMQNKFFSKNKSSKLPTIGVEEAKTKVLTFINKNLMQPGQEVTLKEIVDEDNLYKVVVVMPSKQEIVSYLSKDGANFFPQVMNVAEIEAKNAEKDATGSTAEKTPADTTKEVANVKKTDKAKVELFVMSFCPYGVIAEQVMAPVFALLGKKADINIRYIASVEGNDIKNVQSLHGAIEGIEDARQLCVLKNYNKDILWKYVSAINKDCYPVYREGDAVYEKCWTTAAKNAGIDSKKISTCIEKEGVALIKKEDAVAKGYGVSGSPTLVINGEKVNADRTAEGYKTAICNGFKKQPAECSKKLSTTDASGGAAAAGGCAQ